MPDLFKDLIWDAIVAAALKRLFAAIPWLGWGPIGWIVGWIVGHFMDQLYVGLQEHVDVTKIFLRNRELQLAYDVASVKLYSIASEQGIDSDAFKAQRKIDKAAFEARINMHAA